jgi:gamma-glutamyltranspeptidase/glutathione hydrolase
MALARYGTMRAMADTASPSFWDFPYTSQRMPLLARNVVSTSQPLASAAGAITLARGGNAVDAALATAITLSVVEPCMNGIGSDAFAIVWDGQKLHGLNASGRSPRKWTREHFSKYKSMPQRGWDTVTVPGAVSAWRALSDRWGALPFAELFEHAIRHAREGYLVSPTVRRQWQGQVADLIDQPGFRETFAANGEAPPTGELFKCPGHADTLEKIAKSKGDAFYRGDVARAIADHARATGGLIDEEDLAQHECDWVEPLSVDYGGLTLHEIGPSGQGIAALMALGMLSHLGVKEAGFDTALSHHLQIEACKLAFADLHEWVADPKAMTTVTAQHLLSPAYLASRAKLIDRDRASAARPGSPHTGGTVYLTAADQSGMMVSLIQSNYKGFGSGVVVPGAGIALQNRGAGFTVQHDHPNEVAPRKRPLHTIIPGFITRDGAPLASFGLMGGSMQAQGHVQLMVRIADHGMNPQAASDAARWRVLDDNVGVVVESTFPPDAIRGLEARGHKVRVAPRFELEFGSAQLAMKTQHGYIAASDHRKDGYPVGF